MQEYFVENSSKPGVISFDLAASIFDVSNSKLSKEDKEIYNSIKKLNVIMVPSDKSFYKTEKSKVASILKSDDFEELMSVNNKGMSGKLYYIGDEEGIDEVIIFGNSSDKGFALIRVLGDNMKPENAVKLMKILQGSEVDDTAFSSIRNFFK